MKNNNLFSSIALLVLSCVATAVCGETGKMYITNINKGEMFNDIAGATLSLSEEHVVTKGDLSLKLLWTKAGYAGDYTPKRSNWSGKTEVAFNAFSAADKDRKMTFVIKDDFENRGRPNWGVISFTLKPGMNNIKLNIDGLMSQDGKRKLNLSKVSQWHFSYCMFSEKDWEEKWDGEFIVYISDLAAK